MEASGAGDRVGRVTAVRKAPSVESRKKKFYGEKAVLDSG